MRGNFLKTYLIRDIAQINVGKDLVETSFSKESTATHKYPVYSNSVENRGVYGYYDFEEYPANSLTVVGRGAGLGTSFSRLTGFGAIGRLLILSPKRQCFDVRYLTEYINNRLRIFNESGGIPQLPGEAIGKYKVELPFLPEQKAIADVLSTWDEAIEKTERLVKVQEKMLKQTSRWLLFGHKRLSPEYSVELSDGRFFKYSCDWDLLKISKIAKKVSVKNGESHETVLSCSKYNGFVNSLDYFGKQVFSSDTSNYNVIKKGQFGYPSNHVEEGSIGLLDHCEKGIVSPIYVIFEVLKGSIYPPYLIQLLKTNIYKHIFQVTTSSSVARRGGLRWVDFCKIKVPVPPLLEQQQIAETLNAAQHEIDIHKQLLEKYKTQKRGLMQKLLTGVWRVKPALGGDS
ncbi:MAG: restriction endonuclease subunit S [Chlorobiaceae bacterium]|jgi:restriction endonuclease S subunit